MGLLKNKFIAKFINGGAPPTSFTQQICDRPPPDYEADATQRRIERGIAENADLSEPTDTQREGAVGARTEGEEGEGSVQGREEA